MTSYHDLGQFRSLHSRSLIFANWQIEIRWLYKYWNLLSLTCNIFGHKFYIYRSINEFLSYIWYRTKRKYHLVDCIVTYESEIKIAQYFKVNPFTTAYRFQSLWIFYITYFAIINQALPLNPALASLRHWGCTLRIDDFAVYVLREDS